MFSTLSAFSVSVPVLSVQNTSIEPKSPIADNRFTITLFFFSDAAPWDKQKVITIGNPSGIAVIASAAANKNRSTKLS